MLASPSILLTAAVTILAVVLYMYTGHSRRELPGKTQYFGPDGNGTSGIRARLPVQMNTLEAMPVFLPALWLASIYFTRVGLLAPPSALCGSWGGSFTCRLTWPARRSAVWVLESPR